MVTKRANSKIEKKKKKRTKTIFQTEESITTSILTLYIYKAISYTIHKSYNKRNYQSVKVTNFKHDCIEQASLLLPSGKKPYIQRQQQHITHNV